MSDQIDHRAEAERILRRQAVPPTAIQHLLAAIHDEQQTQTGLLTDLRGAIDDLAEALRPNPGEPCPCGCRRDVQRPELTEQEGGFDNERIPAEDEPVTVACICGSTRQRQDMADLNRRLTMEGKIVLAPGVFGHDGDPLTDEDKERLDALHFAKIDMSDEVHFIAKPDGTLGHSTTQEYDYAKATGKRIINHEAGVEPESVTVTLPRDLIGEMTPRSLRVAARHLDREDYDHTAKMVRALADALDAANTPPAHPAAREVSAATLEDCGYEAATGRTGTNLGRIGWLTILGGRRRWLAREVPGGWTTSLNGDEAELTGNHRTFTPLTPADLGWTVVGEGQVAVDRDDLGFLFAVIDSDRYFAIHGAPANRLRAAVDGEQP